MIRIHHLTEYGWTGTTLSTFTYTRRPDGQITQVDEQVKQPDSTMVSTTTLYSYDALDRLTTESVDTSTVGGDYTKAYTLDLVGNRVKLVTTLEGQSPTETDSTGLLTEQLPAGGRRREAGHGTARTKYFDRP